MKKLVMLLCLGLGAHASNAQWVKAGPEIGLNLTSLSTRFNGSRGDDGIRPGLKVGGVVDIGFSRFFSLQPGLYYSMKGSSIEERVVTTTGNISTIEEYSFDYRINYLELPVNLLFRVGSPGRVQFFFGGGPYLAVALGGRASNVESFVISGNGGSTGVVDRDDYTLRIGTDITDDVTPLDAGVNLNAGVQARGGLFFRANLGLGVANVLPEGDEDNYMRNWGLGLTVGYLFGGR